MYDGVAFEYSGGCPEQDKNVVVVFVSSQKNIQEELDSIFGHSDRTVTLEDVNRMYYLERVIKETMRLFPAVPFIRRSVDEDIKLGRNRFLKFVFSFRILTVFLRNL
jgi:cytochrome P450